jgi:hypothetical protein
MKPESRIDSSLFKFLIFTRPKRVELRTTNVALQKVRSSVGSLTQIRQHRLLLPI